MTPENLTAAATHSREAMTAIRYIAQHGMTYVMTSAEDVPGLLDHIAGLQRVIDDQEERLILQADHIGTLNELFGGAPQVREWLANTKPPAGPGKVDDPAELQRRIDGLTPKPCGSAECPACAHWRGLYERGDDLTPTCEMCGDTGTVPLIHLTATPAVPETQETTP